MENIDDIQIGLTKFRANSSKYFSLFDKHIPRFENDGTDKKFLLLGLNNEGMMLKCCALNKSAEYWVADQAILSETLPLVGPEYNFKFFVGNLDLYDIIKGCDMKFDCIIMNPPYEKNLHLKILAEVITHLKDKKSVCVNLSPVRWLQDPLAKYKKKSDYNKYEKTIRQNITDINIINKIEAQVCFSNTVMGADLAIYVCNKSGGFDCSTLINPIILKVLNKQTSKIVFDNNCKDGIRVRFPIICNNGGSGTGRKISMASFGKMLWFKDGMKDGKPWHDWYMHNQYTKTTDTIPYSAKFNSENEAINFCKQFNTSFCKVYTHWMKSDVHVTPDIVLWMGDAINPRTCKKGYESEWTDEDFYQFFNITDDEKKIIEDTMAKYAK